MPTSQLQVLADAYGVSLSTAEAYWNKAKQMAAKAGLKDAKHYWATVVSMVKAQLAGQSVTSSPYLHESKALVDGTKVPDAEFDAKQLQRGIEVEMEHTDDKDVAKAIAKDHLLEFPDYYTRLDNCVERKKPIDKQLLVARLEERLSLSKN